MSAELNDSSLHTQRLLELKERHKKLLAEKQALLQKVGDGQRLKLDLHETHRGKRNLTSERDRLRNFIDVKPPSRCSTLSDEAEPEDSRSDDDDPLPPPETERSETVRPNQGRRVELAEEMARKTEMDALKLENETLVIQNRKLELKIQGLVGELASLGNKYEELNQLLCRLEAENQRLAGIVNEQHAAERGTGPVSAEQVELMMDQLRTFEEDFNAEKTEREEAQALKARLTLQLSEAKAAIRGYQAQLREVSSGRYVFRPYDEVLPRRGRYYGPANSYLDRDPLNYEMRRSYSGGYIGPSAHEASTRGLKPKRAFLTPDVTAVVDREVVDAPGSSSCQSI